MPRYIDADALLENLKKQYGEELGWQCTVNMSDIGMMIEDAPTADVAPRAEVAMEIFEEIEREITDALKSNYKVLPQVEESEALWNNVNGKINALRGIGYFIEELKKKYTDATDTNVGHKPKGD